MSDDRYTLHLPKVDYLGNGRKDCAVDLKLTVRTLAGERQTTDHQTIAEAVEVSVCGSIWNHIHTDTYSGGQNVDEIACLFPERPDIQRIRELWKRYHLNGMRPGCVHQTEEWTCTNTKSSYTDRIRQVEHLLAHRRTLPADVENTEAIEAAERELSRLVKDQEGAHEEPVQNGWPVIHEKYGEHAYPKRGDSCHVCGRNRWDEPTDACPETGYRYGTAWMFEAVPDGDLDELLHLFGVDQ